MSRSLLVFNQENPSKAVAKYGRDCALRLPPEAVSLTPVQQSRGACAMTYTCTTRKNPISIIAPCHRVIGASGKLTGFAGGLEAKALLLTLERRTPGFYQSH